MLIKNLLLVLVCGALLTMAVGVSAAVGPTDAPNDQKDTQVTRKNGDMYILYSGRSYRRTRSAYRGKSSRLGSTRNRAFRGGGLHGGK